MEITDKNGTRIFRYAQETGGTVKKIDHNSYFTYEKAFIRKENKKLADEL